MRPSTARSLQLNTTFADGRAATEGISRRRSRCRSTHPVVPRTLIHANGVFASYVALGRRLVEDSEEGAEFRVYVVPQAEITVRVKAIHRERMQIGTNILDVRRFELVYVNPSGELATNLTAGDDGGLVRVEHPGAVAGHRARGRGVIDVAHADLFEPRRRSGHHPGRRLQPRRNADATGGERRPARDFRRSCCLQQSGVGDRDGVVQGVPTLAQLAGAIAEAGMLAVRYDKRGNGQSGGRSESATVSDFAEDVRAVVRWLEKRPDVDPKRIAVVGHGEGAWVGLLAASRETTYRGGRLDCGSIDHRRRARAGAAAPSPSSR